MSDGTVRRYELVGDGEYWSMQAMAEGDYMLYDDHKTIVDALRTQARELARALKESRREICPFMYGSPQESAWLQADKDYQCAQAALKEGR